MTREYTDGELEAYLDEALDGPAMASVEAAVRADPHLLQRLAAINMRRNQGVHSVGEIWRRNQLSCPSREQLGSYLLGAMSTEEIDYIRFHVERVGCRLCIANVEDLRRQRQEAAAASRSRRKRYFESSAGYLRSESPER